MRCPSLMMFCSFSLDQQCFTSIRVDCYLVFQKPICQFIRMHLQPVHYQSCLLTLISNGYIVSIQSRYCAVHWVVWLRNIWVYEILLWRQHFPLRHSCSRTSGDKNLVYNFHSKILIHPRMLLLFELCSSGTPFNLFCRERLHAIICRMLSPRPVVNFLFNPSVVYSIRRRIWCSVKCHCLNPNCSSSENTNFFSMDSNCNDYLRNFVYSRQQATGTVVLESTVVSRWLILPELS